MKLKKLLLIAFLSSFSLNIYAQTNDFAMARSVLNTERRALITEGMMLSEEEASVFWPIYDEYELERGKLGDQRINIIKRYAKYYEDLSDDMASSIMADAFALRASEIKLQKKYFGKFKKVLSPKIAARFIQLDDYLNQVIRLQVSDQIPFVPTN